MAVLAGAAMSSAQVIELCTERAMAGEPINIAVDGLSGTPKVLIARVSSSGTLLNQTPITILGQNANAIQAQVPNNYSPGLWQVQVVTSTGTSAPAYINLPEIFFTDSMQSTPGSTLNVYGRNLMCVGSTTIGSVSLVPPSGPPLYARLLSATPYCYSVVIPSGVVPGTTYSVQLNNGWGGATGTVTASQSLTISAAAPDPFGVGLPWGQQFTFSKNVYNIATDPRLPTHCIANSATDVSSTIQTAMFTAWQAGGGVVYLPAGTYLIGAKTLNLLNNVVLEGAGAGQTILEYGNQFTPGNPPTGAWAIQAGSRSLTGLYGLTVQNMNTSGVETHGVNIGWAGTGLVDRSFILNCDLELGCDVGLTSWNSTNFAVENSTITTTSILYPALNLWQDMYLTFKNNTVNFRNGRNFLAHTSNIVVTGNTFNRDNNYMTANCIETGCLELSGARLVYLANNTLQGLGPFPVRTGCGEMINLQFGGDQDYQDVGPVTSATSTTLTNANANWPIGFTPANNFPFNPANVKIVGGTGMGQFRTVASNTSNTLTLTTPWTVTPDSTSIYSIGIWSADHQLILNNTTINSNVGILIWNGALDCVVDGNNVTNCGNIMLRSMDGGSLVGGLGVGNHEHDVCWGDWLSNNTVTDTAGMVPASITVYTCNALGVVNGNGIFDAEVRGNMLTAFTPNLYVPNEWGSYEQYYANIFTYQNGPRTPYNNLGARFLYNNSANIATPYAFGPCGLIQLLTGLPAP